MEELEMQPATAPFPAVSAERTAERLRRDIREQTRRRPLVDLVGLVLPAVLVFAPVVAVVIYLASGGK